MKFFFSIALLVNTLNATLVDIGESRQMFLECEGTGSPTVIFISGRSDRGEIWKTGVFSEVSKWTHACIYDRPGTVTIQGEQVLPSTTTLVRQPTTPKNGVDDLHALLVAAKVKGPFVLVAHSYGGLIARLYASTYPKEVVGLVLIDTLTEYLYDKLPSADKALWISTNSHYSTDLDQVTTQEKTALLDSFELLKLAPPIPPMPAIVLSSDKPYDFKSLIEQGILPENTPPELGAIVFKAHLEGQKQLAEVLKAKQINDTHAGHYIQTEKPQLVIEAIRSVLDQVRKDQ